MPKTTLRSLKLTAVVDPSLSEVSYGWNVLCYEDGEYVTTFVFGNKDDAETYKERWEAGEGSLAHRALLGKGFTYNTDTPAE